MVFKLPPVSSVWRAALWLPWTNYPKYKFHSKSRNFSRVVNRPRCYWRNWKLSKAPQTLWHIDFYLCFLAHSTIKSSAFAAWKKKRKVKTVELSCIPEIRLNGGLKSAEYLLLISINKWWNLDLEWSHFMKVNGFKNVSFQKWCMLKLTLIWKILWVITFQNNKFHQFQMTELFMNLVYRWLTG